MCFSSKIRSCDLTEPHSFIMRRLPSNSQRRAKPIHKVGQVVVNFSHDDNLIMSKTEKETAQIVIKMDVV